MISMLKKIRSGVQNDCHMSVNTELFWPCMLVSAIKSSEAIDVGPCGMALALQSADYS
jgi:hypothetical protein